MRRAALTLLVLPLALTACGGGKKASDGPAGITPIAYVKSSATKTANSPSERVKLRGVVTAQGQQVILTGTGDFDNVKHLGSIAVDFSLAGLTGTIDEVIDGTTLYMRSPLFAAGLPKGKTWLKLDLQKAAAAQGFDLSTLGTQDPTQTLAQLASLANVREIGNEQIGGVDVTHYRGRITKLPGATTAKAKAFLEGATYGPYDVWIGKDDGYVRRVKFGFSTAQKQHIAVTSDFSDFGTDVNVSVPAAAETYDATSKSIPGLGG
jgi:hypothetical protein